jgi:poly-gamma-glutamate capsule biosynthesis protein CapA/YwtB (metallophosphatase superfamily)
LLSRRSRWGLHSWREYLAKEKVRLIAIGDVILNRVEPERIFDHVIDVLREADIRFANCDQMYSDKRDPALSTHTWSDPRNIPALTYAGLDVISLANNHTLDWGKASVGDTVNRLRAAGIQPVGAGENIAEARRPVILETKGTRVGFLAYCTVGPKGYEAGPDKPGFAAVRIDTS